MNIKVLKSSSEGNCICLEKNNSICLLDIGINYKDLSKLIDIKKLKDIAITHKHKDHCSGLWSIYTKKKVNFLCNSEIKQMFEKEKNMKLDLIVYDNFDIIETKNFKFQFFKVPHDVLNFAILINDNTLYITDLGSVPKYFKLKFEGIENLIIESNHDLKMLEECIYHEKLKYRINSHKGHLNNDQTFEFIKEINPKNVYLTHISKEANEIELIEKIYENMNNVYIHKEYKCK